jgi:hypothetical protein
MKITIVLLILGATVIASVMLVGASGLSRQGLPVGGMEKPVMPVGTGNNPVQPVQTGGVPAGGNAGISGSRGFPVNNPGGQLANPAERSMPQATTNPNCLLFPALCPWGIHYNPVMNGGTLTGTSQGARTPEKVEAGSENIHRVSQDQLAVTDDGQLSQPLQPVQQPSQTVPATGSFLRGGSSNNQKGGRY